MKPKAYHATLLLCLFFTLMVAIPLRVMGLQQRAVRPHFQLTHPPEDHTVILRTLAMNMRSLARSKDSVLSDVEVLHSTLDSPAIPADVKCRISQYFQFLPTFHEAEANTPGPIKAELSLIRAKLESDVASGHGDVQSVINTLTAYRKLEEQKGYRVFARALDGAVAVLKDGALDIYSVRGIIADTIGDAAASQLLIRVAIGATLGGFHSGQIAAVVSRRPVVIPTL